MSSFWDRFTAIVRVFVRSSYIECTNVEIIEKFYKIYRNTNAWSTRKSYTGRNTFLVQATINLIVDEMREDLAHMRADLGLILKHLSGNVEKVNGVN